MFNKTMLFIKNIISIVFLLVIFTLPTFSANNESLANKLLIINGNQTTVKLSQLIYYVEQDQLKFTPDEQKAIKWFTNKKYISDENIIVEDSLMDFPKNERSELILGYDFYLKKDSHKNESIILDKISKTGGKDTIDINGKNLEDFVSTAQKSNFKFPSSTESAKEDSKKQNTVSNKAPVTNTTDNKKEPLGFFDYLKIGGVIFIILVVMFLYSGFSSSCPKCGKWFAGSLKNTEEIGRKKSYKTIMATVNHKDKNGVVTGSSTTETKVPITIIEYKNYYSCDYCDHEWVRLSKEEVEARD